jgi:hypothetical protein
VTTRADMIESAYAAHLKHRPVYSLKSGEVDACTSGQRLGPEDWHRHLLTAVLDAVMPQITSVEQLEALPLDTLLLGAQVTGTPVIVRLWADRGSHRCTALGGNFSSEPALAKFGPLTVIWRPS